MTMEKGELTHPQEILDELYESQIVAEFGPLGRYNLYQVEEDKILPEPRDEPPFLVRNIRLGVELKQSGVKTALIIYRKLRTTIDAYMSEELEGVGRELEKLMEIIFEYFDTNEVRRLDQVPSLLEWSQNLNDLERALLALDIPSEASHLDWPLIAYFLPPDKTLPGLTYTQKMVYWLDYNIIPTLVPADSESTFSSPHWDEVRLRLTLNNAYILVVDGLLTGKVWPKDITKFLAHKREETGVRPVLIVLTNAFQDIDNPLYQINEDFELIYLPVPNLEELLKIELQATELMQLMAQAFDTNVIDFNADPENSYYPARKSINSYHLGRVQWATVDRQGIALAPTLDYFRSHIRIYPGQWRPRVVNVVAVPPQLSSDASSIADVEEAIRWRAELNEGFVAGAGTALYRAGQHLLLQEAEGDDESIETHILRAVGNALQEPLKTLLSPLDDSGQILTWVEAAPHTFKWTLDESEVEKPREREQLIEGDSSTPTIIWGDSLELGLITPLPEIKRIIRQVLRIIVAEIIQLLGERQEG